MAFPFVTEEGFEAGTRGHFDAESDNDAKLRFAHYSQLAQIQGCPAPWRGAYAMHVDLSLGTSDAYVQETGSWDMTAGTNELYGRFMLYLSSDLTMATTNEFGILQFWSSTSTVECGIYINYTTANGYRIGIGEASASSFLPITLGKWHSVEFFFNPAGSSSSTLDLWLDGAAATQVGSFTSADITSGVVGVVGQDAGTTKGHVVFDQIVTDDAQIYPPEIRFPRTQLMTKSGHAFVGNGMIENVQLLSGAGTDNVLSIYDTDTANTNDAGNVKAELKNTANNEAVDLSGVPLNVTRGAYVALSGTNPRALVTIGAAVGYGSDGAVRSHGARRGTGGV